MICNERLYFRAGFIFNVDTIKVYFRTLQRKNRIRAGIM